MSRILFFSHSARLQGAERSLLSLVRAARQQGHECLVVVPEPGPLVTELEILGAGVRQQKSRWWMGFRGRMVRDSLRLMACAVPDLVRHTALLRAERPDLVVVNSSVTVTPLLAATVAGIPAVAIIRESIRSNPSLRSTIPKGMLCRLIRLSASECVAISRFVADEFGYPLAIHTPDPAPVSDGTLVPAASREKPIEFSTEQPARFVMLGAISEEKGQLTAVDCFAILRARGVLATLTIYGPASEQAKSALIQSIEVRGLGEMVGYGGEVADPFPVLAGADFSLVCSQAEAYGRITAESILAGTPVFGFDAGATPEILAAGGGVLTPPDAGSMARSIMSVLPDAGRVAALRDSCRKRSVTRAGLGDAAVTIRCLLQLLGEPSVPQQSKV